MKGIESLLRQLRDCKRFYGNPRYKEWREAIEYEIMKHYLPKWYQEDVNF